MPDAPGLELLAAELNSRTEGSILGTSFEHGQAALIANPETIRETLSALGEAPGSYTFLSSVHAADYLPREPRFAVHYELLNMARVERIRVKALLADPSASRPGRTADNSASSASRPGAGLPEIDSVTDLFPTADFQEREIYDFFGIVFRGHPDMRRILMPEDYVGWPQRRDFPIGGDPVIFTYDEDEIPGWTR